MQSILFPIEPITFPLFSFAKERIDACLAASLSPYAQRKEHWIGWMDDDCEDHFWRQSAIIREATQWRLIFSWHWNEETDVVGCSITSIKLDVLLFLCLIVKEGHNSVEVFVAICNNGMAGKVHF